MFEKFYDAIIKKSLLRSSRTKVLMVIPLIVLIFLVATYNNSLTKLFFTESFFIDDIAYKSSERNFTEIPIPDEYYENFISVTIDFDFVINDYHKYDNIFEFGSNDYGIRMEFGSINHLGLVINKGKKLVGTTISNEIIRGEKYHVSIRSSNGSVSLELNGNPIEIAQPTESPKFKFLSVGYGFSEKRAFNGDISNLKIDYQYSVKPYYAKFVYGFTLFILLFVLYRVIVTINIESIPPKLRHRTTVIVLIVLTTLIVAFAYNSKVFSQFYKYKTSVSNDLRMTTEIYKFFLQNEIEKDIIKLFTNTPKPNSELESFYISINRDYIKNLNKNLPHSGKEKYYPAFLKISNDGKLRKIKMRYRGEGNFHWFYKQKSLRIKLKKGDLYNLERKFNLINPPFLHGFRDIANYKIARKLGLISPDCYPVRVFINGEYMGVYLYVSQVDEGLVRKHKLMPGSIYYGDSGAAPINQDGVTDLWYNPKYWSKKGSRNKEQNNFRDDINFFINSISNKSESEFFLFFNQFINKQKLYNYIALDRITGSGHHDHNHNHKLYFDPYKGLFEPIEWDLRFWDKSKYKDVSRYPLLLRIKYNPILDYESDKATLKLYRESIEEELFKIYENNTILATADLLTDKYKDTITNVTNLFNSTNGYLYSKPYSFSDQTSQLRDDRLTLLSRKETLLAYFNKTDIKLTFNKIGKNKYKLDYFVSGNTPVMANFSKLTNVSKITRLHNGKLKKIKTSSEMLYPGRAKAANDHNVILFSNKKIINAYEKYTYILEGINNINHDSIKYTNALTGSLVTPKLIKQLNKTATSIHPWDIEDEDSINVTLSGNINVTSDLHYPGNTNVTISPGTTFTLDPNVSIFFYGMVSAIGTEKDKIVFKSKDHRPWGAIVIQGEKTTGSIFEHVDVSNGSITSNNLIQYTAQFNIHDNNNFIVRNCSFSNNNIGDDNVHVAYSVGLIENSIFLDSNSDALDVDISDVKIINSVFNRSGNDGLDIMTTNLFAKGNVFAYNKDKGLSAGEWSNADISDSLFIRASIGIAAKDKSHVTTDNLLFIDTINTVIDAYRKNVRYDTGGYVDGGAHYVFGNRDNKADELSEVNIKSIHTQMPVISEQKWLRAALLPKAELRDIMSIYEISHE